MPRTGAIASSTTVMLAAAIVYLGIVAVHGPTFPRTTPGWIAIFAILFGEIIRSTIQKGAGENHKDCGHDSRSSRQPNDVLCKNYFGPPIDNPLSEFLKRCGMPI